MLFLESTCAAHVGVERASLALLCPQMHFAHLRLCPVSVCIGEDGFP